MNARALALAATLLLPCVALSGIHRFPHSDRPSPLGRWYLSLPNGNVAVADGSFDRADGTQDVGVVSLYAADGRLIQRVEGQREGDALGSGGLTLLTNGHYVVASPGWSDGTRQRVGAVTWAHAERGLPDRIAASNSLVGSTHEDVVGRGGVTALANGHFIVASVFWNAPGRPGAGAITWARGDGTTVGPVSAANSLVGGRSHDLIDQDWHAFPDGSGLLLLRGFDNGTAMDAGALLWLRADQPTAGVIGSANALVGTTAGDFRNAYLTPTPNGLVAFSAPHWDAPGAPNAGAVTVVSATLPRTGSISAANALIGASRDDLFGIGATHPDHRGIVALATGELAVISPAWSDFRGAVHRVPNSPSLAGVAGLGNAVVGRYAGDNIGIGSVLPMPDGGLVIVSPGAAAQPVEMANAGAITVAPPGFGGMTLAPSNSWFGPAANERWGQSGAVRLSDGRVLTGTISANHAGRTAVGGVAVLPGTPGGGSIASQAVWYGNREGGRFGDRGPFPREARRWMALPNGEALVAVPSYDLDGVERDGVLHIRADTPRGVLGPTNVQPVAGEPVAMLALAGGRFAVMSEGGLAFDSAGRFPSDIDRNPARRWSPAAGHPFFRALALSNGRVVVLGGEGSTMTVSTVGPGTPAGQVDATNSLLTRPLCYPHLGELPGGRFAVFSASEFAIACSSGGFVLASIGSSLSSAARDWEYAQGDVASYDADYPPLPDFDAGAGRMTIGDRGSVLRLSLDGGDRPPAWTREPTLTVEMTPRPWSALVADAQAVDADGDVISYAYAWFRDGQPIAGATSARYALTPVDRGAVVAVRITAEASGQSIRAEPAVYVPRNQPPDSPRVSISGQREPGQTLTATVEPVRDPDGDPISLSYAWATEAGQTLGTASTYVVQDADVDRVLRLTVIASDGIDRSSTLTEVFISSRSPVASGDRFRVQGPMFEIAAPGVLANDLHVPPADQRELSIVSVNSNDTDLVLRLRADGSVSGHAGRNVDQTMTFRYRLCRSTSGHACTEGEVTLERSSQLLAIDDRLRVRMGAEAVTLDPLVNDLIPVEANPASITLLGNTAGARASIVGTTLQFTPSTDPARVDQLHYRVCLADGRCSEAGVELHTSPGAIIEPSMRDDRGRTDFGGVARPGGLRAHVAAFAPVPAETVTGGVRHVRRDADPMTLAPSDRLLVLRDLAPAGSTSARRFLITSGQPFIVGVDRNRNGRADRDERTCAGQDFRPSAFDPPHSLGAWCEIDGATAASTGAAQYWVMVYSHRPLRGYSAEGAIASVDIHAVALEETTGFSAWRDERPGQSYLSMSWDRSDLAQLHGAVGFVRFIRIDGTTEWWPYRISHPFPSPSNARPVGVAPGARARLPVHALRLVDGMTHFVDVPPGAQRLRFTPASGSPVELRAARAAGASVAVDTPQVLPGPAARDATAVATAASSTQPLDIDNPAAGRWYFAAISNSEANRYVDIAVELQAAAPTLRPGSYFNPERSGHGLFVYPAGDQWAALWYAYSGSTAEDATWYYAQAVAPGRNGTWHAPLFRSTWSGGRNHLAPAGHLTLTANANDRMTFTYTIEGRTGSETLHAFGRGCPTIAGQRRDQSGHWFNPARAGTGYSIQMFPHYEFYIAFGYDRGGNADFRVAEGARVDTPEAGFEFSALTGFCHFCERRAAPERRATGTFTRHFQPDGRLKLKATERAGEEPGSTWTFDEVVIPLGGLQGCDP